MYLRITIILLFLVGMPLLAMSHLGDSARDRLEASKEAGLAFLDSTLADFSRGSAKNSSVKTDSIGKENAPNQSIEKPSTPKEATTPSSGNYLVLETNDSRAPQSNSDPNFRPAFDRSGKLPTNLVRREISVPGVQPTMVAPPVAPKRAPTQTPTDSKQLELELRLHQLGGSHLAWRQIEDGTFQYQCRAHTEQGLYKFTGVGATKAIALLSLVDQLSR